MAGALDGTIIVDLSQGIAGGYCTKLFAGLGAEVIKVEPPGKGDVVRSMAPFKDDIPDLETSTVHLHLSMAKKSVTLSLDSASGRDIFRKLIRGADVVVESYRPGYLKDIGLDYDALSAEDPRLIVTSITHFGQDGPYAQYEGNELVDYSASGYTYLTGLPDKEPIKAGGSQAQYQGGLHGAAATMAALSLRDQTDRGDHLDVSITEAIAYTHAGMAPYLNLGNIYQRVGARLLSEMPTAPYPSTILPTADGFIHAHWAPTDPSLLGVLTETPRLTEPEVWETPRGHADEIDELLGAWLMKHDKFEAVRKAQEMRHPFTEVLSISDLVTDPQFVERNYFVELEHPEAGKFKHLGAPFGMTGTPFKADRAPLLGEHNIEVYRDRLGFSLEELVALRDRGVI